MHGNEKPALSIKANVPYEDFRLDVDLNLVLDGVTGLFGPSGGGKSTLLRVIAGLEKSATGQLRFGNEIWMDSAGETFVPPHKRSVGYVFQDGRLFDHQTVAGNLQYAAERAATEQDAIQFDEILSIFDLQPLLRREVGALSGGERQRVAIARTLLTQPRLLLLDEPLAALDAGRKGEILPYLEALPPRFGIPSIYVSHSIDEIARLADQVVVLDKGRVKAVGGAAEVLNQLDMQSPSSQFDVITILETRLLEDLPDLGLTRLDHHGQTIVVPRLAQRTEGEHVRLHIRAGDVALATKKPEGISFRNILAGTLSKIDAHPDSPFATVSVAIDGATLRAHLTRQAVAELKLESGMPVFALLKTASFDQRS
jgi:molybdate transport system ATP-binding protein